MTREHRSAGAWARVPGRAMLLSLIAATSLATVGAAQIVAPAGRTLFNEGVLVRSLLRLDTFEESSDGEDLTRLSSVNELVWGALPHTSFSLVVPVVQTERSDSAAGGRDSTATGTADASVIARYDVLRRTVPRGYTRLAPELGVKLPTGGTFGTGSTDVIAGLVFSHIRDPDWWIADVQLTVPGSGDGGIRAGDRLRLDLAYLRRVFPRGGQGVPMALFVVELNGESVGRTKRSGVEAPDSGGDVLLLSPGFEYMLNRRLVLEASLPIPIYEELHGTQPIPEVSMILGMRWLF